VVLRFCIASSAVDEVLWEFRKRLWLASLVVLFVTGAAALSDLALLLGSRGTFDCVFAPALPKAIFVPLMADRSGDATGSFGGVTE